MARQTRRKSRTKRSPPQRTAEDTLLYRREVQRRDRDEIKKWKVSVMLTCIFLLALFIRVYFNVSEATEDGFEMTGGSDPYYHKRAVDWVVDEHEHLTDDPMLNYPIGIPNPRPPIFDWSLALVGIILSPFFGGDSSESTWWAVEFMPALWGALIIFPVYFIGKESFNKRTGILAAFFISIMAGHVGHTTFGLADHDSFFLFFAVVSIYYFQRALNTMKDGVFVKTWWDSREVRYGFGEMVRKNKISLCYALFSGMTMTVIALAWKGFPYIMTIVVAYYVFQLFINKLRNVDSLNLTFISIVALSLPLILSSPYYAMMGFVSWWTPPLYMFIASAVASIFFVPTRKVPWILVFSIIISIIVISLVLLLYVFEDFGSLVLGGAQYFVRSKLFDTIAEAQPPTFSRIVFSYGLVSFFLAFFIGIPYVCYIAFKSKRKDMMFILVWAVLAAYMASSAVRFIFNGTPVMAIICAYILVEIFEWVDFRKMIKDIRTHSARGEALGDKFRALYKGTGLRHVCGVILIAIIVIPNFGDAVDAGIPYERKKEWDNKIYDFFDDSTPEATDFLTDWLLVPDNDTYNKDEQGYWYLGAFGPSFPNGYWLSYFDWLKEQDNMSLPEDRPAFLSWWDYGFWAIELGEHPTVADNFQTGYQFAGNFIAAQGENESIALLIQRVLDANIREHGRDYGEKEEQILLGYLNQTTVDHLLWIYKHAADFETDDVSAENGRIRAMKDLLTGNLTLDELADIYHALQVSTGNSIRYFAIDARLFPFSASNNIFYAPVTLADLEVETFLETMYIPGDAEGNPTGEKLNATQVEERAETDKDLTIVDTALEYKDEFFQTMLYKTYIGWYGVDINMTLDAGIPGVSGDLSQNSIMPGWMMKHFKEVYRTFYWNPYSPDDIEAGKGGDDWEPMSYPEAIERGGTQGNISHGMSSGVTCLKYYDGAIVSGKVVTDHGMPVEGIRITMYDDAGVPHDTVDTDENGEYSVIAPFGTVALIASKGGMLDQEHILLQLEQNVLNTTTFNVTDNQAMRLEDYNITKNLVIPSATLEGEVYWDLDANREYNDDTDSVIEEGTIVLREMGTDNYYNLTADKLTRYGYFDPETGEYQYNGIPPGDYILSLQIGAHIRDIKFFTDDTSFYPAEDSEDYEMETVTQDIIIEPATITGTLNYVNGTRAIREVTIIDTLDDSEQTIWASEGKFLVTKLLNSTYEVRVDGDDIFQAYIEPLTAIEGEVRDRNITLYPAMQIKGTTYYDGEVRDNITVYFNATVPGLSTQAVSDENGVYTAKVAATTYDITASEYVADRFHAVYLRESFSLPKTLDLNMGKTFELYGKLYYDRNGNDTYDQIAVHREEVPEGYVILRGKGFVLYYETDGQGDYVFRLPKGHYTLEGIDNETSRVVTEDVIMFGDKEVMLQLGSAVTVDGKVTHSGWKGEYATNLVPGATLEFRTTTEEYSTVTDSIGEYKIFLPEDSYEVTVEAFGFEIATGSLVVEGNITKDFILTPLDITVDGFVRYKGEPVEGVEVRFDDDYSAITNEQGYYSIVAEPGFYYITYEKVSTDLRYFHSRDLTLNIGSADVSINVPLTRQLKVSGTFIQDNDERDGNILFDSKDYSVAENIENGSFETYVISGDYRIQVDMDGDVYHRLISIREPMVLDMEDDDFRRIRGYVYNDVDQNDKYSNSDKGIQAKMTFENSAGLKNETTTTTGRFDFKLYEGTYDITITAHGYKDFLETHTYTGDSEYNFEMEAYPIELSGTVWFDDNDDGTMQSSETIAYAPVMIEVKSSDYVYKLQTDHSGNYSLLLSPGDYSASCEYSTAGKNFSYSVSVYIEEDEEEVTQNMNLRLTYEVTGMVYDYIRGTPVPDAEVEFLDERGNTVDQVDSKDDGSFLILVPEGDYTLYSHNIMPDGLYIQMKQVSVTGPKEIDINLMYGVQLEGKLYSGDLDHGVDIGRIDLTVSENMMLNDYTGNDGEFSFFLPMGRYHLSGDMDDDEETPDARYILDQEIIVDGSYNYNKMNIEVEKQILNSFDWSVDKTSEVSYIGYTANGYRGAQYTFNITNTGNQSQSYALTYSFDNRTYFENIAFDTDTVDIPAGEFKEVTFRVRAQDIAPAGRKAEIIINITCTEEEEVSDEMVIMITAKKAKQGDAVIREVTKTPTNDTYENDEFTLTAELSNIVEFSKDFNVTVIFEHRTRSGQWEAVAGKNVTTLIYGTNVTVSQVIREGKGTHEYQVRLIPMDNEDDSRKDNNAKTITVVIKEEPEEELTGWHAYLDLGTNDKRISIVMLFSLMAIIAVVVSVIYSGRKKRKRSRRYKKRHAK